MNAKGILRAATLGLALLPAGAPAVQPLFNGDFEAGVFQGWMPGGTEGGYAAMAGEGGCFSFNDTSGLSLNGNFAALLRSNAAGAKGSTGTLTSEPFTAGSGISFALLSESGDWIRAKRPVTLEVRLLDASGTPLVTHTLSGMSVVRLHAGCPSEPRNGVFSAHYIDTRALAGQEVKLQFAQHTNVGGSGFFTLVDDVTLYEASEMALFVNRPEAVAGTSLGAAGSLQLDGSASFHPLGLEMTYRWFLDGEATPLTGQKAATGDLAAGAHRAVLFVDDGTHVIGDTLLFVVPEKADDGDGSGDEDTDGAQ